MRGLLSLKALDMVGNVCAQCQARSRDNLSIYCVNASSVNKLLFLHVACASVTL